MEGRAVARYQRIAPRKARIVMDLIRGKSVPEAIAILQHTPKRGARIISKVVRSAVANADHNFDMDVESLQITRAFVDEGPTLKRWRPQFRGMPAVIRKRTSHITVVVGEREEE